MVVVNEVLANPTVETVSAEVRFPTLLAIERKMPDIQLALIDRFPELQVLYQFNVVIGDPTKLANPANLPEQLRQPTGDTNRIYQFNSQEGETLNITTNSIALVSKSHKSYNRGEGKRFRQLIDFAMGRILEQVRIPFFDRVGLRYVDACPFERENGAFRRFYTVPFPIDRFPLANVEESYLATRVALGEEFLFYQGVIRKVDSGPKFTLDYDAYKLRVPTTDLLTVLDRLHDIILSEYGKDLTEDSLQRMRGH